MVLGYLVVVWEYFKTQAINLKDSAAYVDGRGDPGGCIEFYELVIHLYEVQEVET